VGKIHFQEIKPSTDTCTDICSGDGSTKFKFKTVFQNLPNYGRQAVTHPAASSEPGSRHFQTFRSHPQGAFDMATLEHLTFLPGDSHLKDDCHLVAGSEITATFHQ
jgi:hypothetical protein